MIVPQVVLTLDQGGQEQVVIQLAERLERRGIRSPVIALAGGTLIPEAMRRGLTTEALGKANGLDLALFPRLYRLLRRHGANVVHTHNFAPLIYGTFASRAAGVRTVNTRHGRAALSANAIVWSLTDRVVAVSEDARHELLKHNRVDPAKVSVILNGIDVAAFGSAAASRPQVRADLGIPADARVFGIVARLAPEKDHETLLRAFAHVVAGGGDARLVIIGGGPTEGALRSLAKELRVDESVQFLGFRDDVATLLHALDVFVLSSLMEGISLTLLEAMAAGLPVVTTAVGGNPEVVVDGETGLLVPPRDAEGMAKALARMRDDVRAAEEFGTRGRERVRARFNIDRMVDAYVAIYAEVSGLPAA